MSAGSLPFGLQLRAARPSDASELGDFAASIFRETFGHSAPEHDVRRFLDEHYGHRQQLAEITDPEMLTRLAIDGAAIAAFYQLRRPPPGERHAEAPAAEIARFYVGTAWHGRGVATPLMNAALADARAAGARRVWLGVWEENARGIAFYRRCGFEAAGHQVFLLGSVPQRDLVMARSVPGS